MLAGLIKRLVYLSVGLSIILVFVGVKFMISDLVSKVPIWVFPPFIATVVTKWRWPGAHNLPVWSLSSLPLLRRHAPNREAFRNACPSVTYYETKPFLLELFPRIPRDVHVYGPGRRDGALRLASGLEADFGVRARPCRGGAPSRSRNCRASKKRCPDWHPSRSLPEQC